RDKNPGVVKCIFASRIHPHKNLHIAIKAVLNIQSDSKVIFDVYGVVDDQVYYEQCVDMAKTHNKSIEINFKGPLPHNELFTTLKQYHLFILPTLGENFGHVIFEAMSAGCPLLISDKTPWTDVMKSGAGWIAPCYDVKEYTNVIMKVCAMDRETLNLVSLNVRNYADHYIKSINAIDRYFQLFQ
ncbi:MAG: glycosyltransferase, partial [Chitinophagaceae bacterium]|nr:glycosyltransferase [Chitinophagaceae bacterium]